MGASSGSVSGCGGRNVRKPRDLRTTADKNRGVHAFDDSNDTAAAQVMAKERWGTLGRQGNQQLQNAGVGLGRAVHLGINRAPAIVFDDKSVVYGVTDVAYAAQIYRSSLASGGARK
jgi:Protein of unknown function (DUF1525)